MGRTSSGGFPELSVPCKGFVLEIEGRADGVWERKEGVVIDEIKGVFKDLALLEEPVEVHLAQAPLLHAISTAVEH